MKKIYIPLLCATVGSCTGMYYNNTTAIVSQSVPLGALVASQGSSIKTCAPHVPTYSCIGKGGLNRKQRRAQGPSKKSIKQLNAEKSQLLSKQINHEVVGCDDCSFNPVAQLMYKLHVLELKKLDAEASLRRLVDIDYYVQQDPDLLDDLVVNNTHFNTLVTNVIFGYGREKMITGSTVDAFFNDPESMFEALSPELSKFIGRKVTEEIINKYNDTFNEVRPPYNDRQDMFPDWGRMCLTLRTQPEIHRTPLLGSECPIDGNSIEISDDSRYIRAADTNGNKILWSTFTGKQSHHVNENDFEWIKKEVYQFNCGEYPQKVTFSAGERYHVAFDDEDSEAAVLYLYAETTWASQLVRVAMFNSLDNRAELQEVLDSSAMNRLNGFVRKNVKRIIKQAEQAIIDETN